MFCGDALYSMQYAALSHAVKKSMLMHTSPTEAKMPLFWPLSGECGPMDKFSVFAGSYFSAHIKPK